MLGAKSPPLGASPTSSPSLPKLLDFAQRQRKNRTNTHIYTFKRQQSIRKKAKPSAKIRLYYTLGLWSFVSLIDISRGNVKANRRAIPFDQIHLLRRLITPTRCEIELTTKFTEKGGHKCTKLLIYFRNYVTSLRRLKVY